MSKELIERLRELSASRKPYATGAHGQIIGMESYRIVANGFALECIDEAADRIEELERKVASRDAEVAKLKDDNEYLYVAAIERDQLRAKINVLREALSSAESALDESRDYPVTYDEVITALITTPEQSLAEYRNKVIEE
jgi:DNA repair exonuclease SbcCD ATPase subunit